MNNPCQTSNDYTFYVVQLHLVSSLFCSQSQYTGVWKYYGVYKMLRCLTKNGFYTKMLRPHLFRIFIIKTPLIVKTLTNVL